MNRTRNRGYSFPQCDPPYIKDVADAPAQLKALALAVEADVSDLDDQIQAASFPSAAVISQSTVQNLSPGARVGFDTLDYGPASMFDNANDALIIEVNGLYWVTAWGQTNAMTTDYVWIAVHRNTTNGNIVRDNRLPNQAGVSSNVRINAHGLAILTAGDRVFMTQHHDDATAPWNMVALGCAKLADL